MDEDIPTPEREIDKPFLMPVEDVFTIQGRGTVATGRVERGQIKVGETVEIVGIKKRRPRRPSRVLRCSVRFWTTAWLATTLVFFFAVSSVKMWSVVRSS